MIGAVQERVRHFTRDVLERRGALVDWSDDLPHGMAVLPAPVAAALQCPEDLRLTDQPDGHGRFCANLATDFLERVQPLLAAEPCVVALRIRDLHVKKSDLRETIERAFTWDNAKVTVLGAAMNRAEYHTWYFRAAINSEESWEEIVRVDMNGASGAVVRLPDVQAMDGLDPNPQASPLAADSYERASKHAAVLMQTRGVEFLQKMEARIQRDRQRLRGYYDSLLKEGDRPRRRSAKPVSDEDRASRRLAVEVELARKLAELDERYATTAELAPVACIRLDIPVLVGQIQVLRRKASRLYNLTWNPLTKQLEPMVCSACAAPTFAVAFTDETVDPRCLACARAKA